MSGETYGPACWEKAFQQGFRQDLERLCRPMVIPSAVMAMVSWLLFLALDLELYPGRPLVVVLRLGLSFVGAAGALL